MGIQQMTTYEQGQPHIIKDNVECLRIIVDLGVLDSLTPIPGANSAFHTYTTDDHYCMASYHKEHGTKEDDGYLIVMVPKTTWSFDRAAQFFANCIVDNTDGIHISYDHKKAQKQNN